MQSTPQNRGPWRESNPENPNRINLVTAVPLFPTMSPKPNCNKKLEEIPRSTRRQPAKDKWCGKKSVGKNITILWTRMDEQLAS